MTRHMIGDATIIRREMRLWLTLALLCVLALLALTFLPATPPEPGYDYCPRIEGAP